MVELAIELAVHDPIYEDMALKFPEHFYFIATAMNQAPALKPCGTKKTDSITTCWNCLTAAPRD